MEPKQLLINNIQILDNTSVDQNGWLLCQDGKIMEIGTNQNPELKILPHCQIINGTGLTLVPGFIDSHVHGALGAEAMDANRDGLLKMATFYATHGVTGFLPTTWAADMNTLRPVVQTIKDMMTNQPTQGAHILGIHLEGPFINADKAGAQNPDFIMAPDPTAILPLLDLDVIKIITLAPEIPENHWLIHECIHRGITVSAGHTNANYDQMVAAIEMGVSQTTHTFNAMTGLHHRKPGTVGAALALDALSCELIADGIHLHPAILKIVLAAKTPDRVILVTDAMRGTGLPDGNYPVDERIITIKDGAARLPEGQLAGSTLSLDQALRNMVKATDSSLKTILPTITRNPARSIHISHQKGSISVGMDADLVLLDEELNVKMTIVAGMIVYPTLR